MSAYPTPAKVTIGADRIVKVVISRARAYYSRAGTETLAEGVREVEVEFTTPMADTNWVFGSFTFWNSTDARVDVVQLQATGVTAKSQGGFTVLLNGAPPTGNYKMDWTIAEAYNP